MEKRQQPKWIQPETQHNLPPLLLHNSLTGKKEKFIPKNGSHVTWYSCGPTVYDASHMGHARSYISFDILRRVLVNYFGFKVKYVMNITDVDDKIIKRARQNYLIQEYFLNAKSMNDVKRDIRNAIKVLEQKAKTAPELEMRTYLKSEVERLRKVLTCRSSITGLLTGAHDALCDLLDKQKGAEVTDNKIFGVLSKQYEEEFHQDMRALRVLDADILTRVSEYIQPIIKYIEKIISNGFAYSVPTGSVYFDTNRFANTEGHFYAKLVPTAYGDAAQLKSGEGDLTVSGEKRSSTDFALWKASKPGEPSWPSPWGNGRPGWHIECSVMASDICGDGMDIHTGGVDLKFPHHDNELAQAEAYFGHSHWVNYFLHTGHLTISGCKMSKSLKNFITIRQALKRHSAQELRYAFLLHGWRDTLDYSDSTMTEALNFSKLVTDFLFNVSHVLRLASLQPQSAAAVDAPNHDLLETLKKSEKEVFVALCDSVDTRKALSSLRELINCANQSTVSSPITSKTANLKTTAHHLYAVAAFVLRLLRVFGAGDDTTVSHLWPNDPLAFNNSQVLPISLVKEAKLPWLSSEAASFIKLNSIFEDVLSAAASFVGDVREAMQSAPVIELEQILKNFDVSLQVNLNVQLDKIEIAKVNLEDALLFWDATKKPAAKGSVSGDVTRSDESAWPIIAELLFDVAELRQAVRSVAQSKGFTGADAKRALLIACDRLRDQRLPQLGVRLEDRADLASGEADLPAIGLVDAKLLAAEKQEKLVKVAERKQQDVKQQQTKLEAGRLPASEFFRQQIDKYSVFDDAGMPTHDADGKELAKSQLKKLQKLYDAQAKRHETFLRAQQNS